MNQTQSSGIHIGPGTNTFVPTSAVVPSEVRSCFHPCGHQNPIKWCGSLAFAELQCCFNNIRSGFAHLQVLPGISVVFPHYSHSHCEQHFHGRKQKSCTQVYHHGADTYEGTWKNIAEPAPCAEAQDRCLKAQFTLWNIYTAAAQTLDLAGFRKQALCCRCAVCDMSSSQPVTCPLPQPLHGHRYPTNPQACGGWEKQFFLHSVIFQLTKVNQTILIFNFWFWSSPISTIDLLKGQDEILEKTWGQTALPTSSLRLVLWQPDFESSVLAPKQKLYNLSLETFPCNSMCHLPRK